MDISVTFGDETSKKIFLLLMEMELHHIKSPYIKQIVKTSYEANKLMSFFPDEKVYIYGAGNNGLKCSGLLRGRIEAFIDSDVRKQNKLFDCNPVVSMDEVDMGMSFVVSPEGNLGEDIERTLIKSGVSPKRIIKYSDLFECAPSRFFDHDIINISRIDSYVDVGASDGDTVSEFIKHSPNYDSIYAYEPVPSMADKICSMMIPRVYVKTEAVWNASSEMELCEFGEKSELSWVSSVGTRRITTTTLDAEFNGERIDFIKINVNGYEKRVIEGGKSLLGNYKPILSISFYPSFSLIGELIEQIHICNNKYRFFLRNYGLSGDGVVLYAI